MLSLLNAINVTFPSSVDVMATIVAGLVANNFILVQFLGICPFLGVSIKIDSALGMGLAVTAVMVLTTVTTYPLYAFVLVPLGLEYLEIILFILVIAALVQMLEMILKKYSPGLYSALGIYLPLVTTNCAILGIAESVIGFTATADGVAMSLNLGGAVLSGLFYGLGFTLAIVLLAGLRQKVDKLNLPKCMKGFPITMITACFMAMAFYVFTLI